jgi:hypothetical protein
MHILHSILVLYSVYTIYIYTSHNWQIALDSFDVIMGIMKWLCLWCGHFVWSYYMISGLYSIYITEIDGQFCIKHRYAHIQMYRVILNASTQIYSLGSLDQWHKLSLPSTDGPGYFYPGQERVSTDVEGPTLGLVLFQQPPTLKWFTRAPKGLTYL